MKKTENITDHASCCKFVTKKIKYLHIPQITYLYIKLFFKSIPQDGH